MTATHSSQHLPRQPIPILYEDDYILAVDKPAGLLTVPGRGPDKQDCLINRLLPQYPSAKIIHRLDMATSGIVIIALSAEAQSRMSKLFAQREIEKRYIAKVSGKLTLNSGSIEHPLICDWENRPKQKVDYENGKSALTHYQLLNYSEHEDVSRIELKPYTGRSHQLRVHMLAIGHPILGDVFYAPLNIVNKSPRLLLHAQEVDFKHPMTDQSLNISSPAPF